MNTFNFFLKFQFEKINKKLKQKKKIFFTIDTDKNRFGLYFLDDLSITPNPNLEKNCTQTLGKFSKVFYFYFKL